MSSIHETAYPRFKPEITPRELADVYTPTPEEQAFARRQGRTLRGRLGLLVLVKTAQRLGYYAQAGRGAAQHCHPHRRLLGDPILDEDRNGRFRSGQ